MTRITESDIEQLAIDLLEKQGFQYIYAPDGEKPERNSYDEVLLIERLQNAIRKINPIIPADAQQETLKVIYSKKIQ